MTATCVQEGHEGHYIATITFTFKVMANARYLMAISCSALQAEHQ